MKLYAIRHGRTDYNDLGLAQGRTDILLNEQGREEVTKFRTQFPDISFSKIFVSPLKRALETAQILFPNQELLLDDRLVERSFGAREGTLSIELPEIIDDFSCIQLPDQIEPLQELYDRIVSFIEDSRDLEGPILLVTHGGVMNILFYIENGIPNDGKCPFQWRKNNELVEYDV